MLKFYAEIRRLVLNTFSVDEFIILSMIIPLALVL